MNTRARKPLLNARPPSQSGLFPQTSEVSDQQNTVSQHACLVAEVGKRRDGGTRYWCLNHKADATAKYGRPASACRAAHIPPITPEESLSLNVDKYPGGVALWGGSSRGIRHNYIPHG